MARKSGETAKVGCPFLSLLVFIMRKKLKTPYKAKKITKKVKKVDEKTSDKSDEKKLEEEEVKKFNHFKLKINSLIFRFKQTTMIQRRVG